MTLAMDDDELVLKQPPDRKSLAVDAGWTNRQLQFAPIKQLGNVQRAARPKIQRHPGSNPRNMRSYRGDQNDRRVIVHRYTKARRRFCRAELNGFKRRLQPVKVD